MNSISQSPPAKSLSLRVKITALAVLPALAIGAAWLITTSTLQANDTRALLVQGARQVASMFAQTVLEESRATVNPSLLRINLERRLEALVKSSTVALEFAAVADANGRVLFVRDARSDGTSVEWGSLHPEANDYIAVLARDERSSGGTIARLDGRELLPVYARAETFGAVLALQLEPLQRRVAASTALALGVLCAALIAAAATAALFAARLVGRITTLAASAERVSRGESSQTLKDGVEDELGTLAAALERLQVSVEILMSRRARRDP